MSKTAPPLMLQYRRIKAEHPNAILMFQVGDFYEMFEDDAKLASGVLELTLTARDKNGANPVPLCGIPLHAADNYVARLIRAGYNVAMCEQMEEAGQGKGIVRREVTRILTPGTLVEDHLLDGSQSNYLAAACPGPADGEVGLAYVDVSTGDFRLVDLPAPEGPGRLVAELTRMECKELLVPEGWQPDWHGVTREGPGFDAKRATAALCDHLGVATLSGYGIDKPTPAVAAAGAVLAFLGETQRSALPQITKLTIADSADYMVLDAATQRNLELTRRIDSPGRSSSGRQGTLLGLLDRTGTAMGGRLLHDWLTGPLLNRDRIHKRLEAVAWGVAHQQERGAIRDHLAKVSDLERLATRIAMGRAVPRDLASLCAALAMLPGLGKLLPNPGPRLLSQIASHWDDLADVQADIAQTLADEPPIHLKDGGVIRDGVDQELDELRAVGRDVRGILAALEQQERTRTGIETLKIRHNNVFGYYIEVTKAKLAEKPVPDDYVRKQTLVNAERFITSELKELENRIFSAGDRIERLETRIYTALRERVSGHVERLQWSAAATATVDCLMALAHVATDRGWNRPEITDGAELDIHEGRHPVVEAHLPAGTFVANDTDLPEAAPIQIVTGPNMAGKSTYLRQTALICLLAQMGSFVPAKRATVGIVDRIFSRIGASDNVGEGLSTFMVEMTETANILHHATGHSLVILDEIGRGTSTFDGLSIAWAVAEFLHDTPHCRTLFATHYHELTELAARLSGVRNVNVRVKEWNDEIVFLHKIAPGGAESSYGIQVARLAGLPRQVVSRARAVLADLEAGEGEELRAPQALVAAAAGTSSPMLSGQRELFAPEPDPVVAELASLRLEGMTPLEALNTLYALQQHLSDSG